MLAAIKYNLTHLAVFEGRDARSTFWFYVLFLVLAHFAVSFAISLPFAGSMMGTAITAAHDGASDAEVRQRMMAQMGTMMRSSMWMSVVLSLVTMALVAASFTRRLHDSDKPGWLTAVAIVIQLVALGIAIASLEDAVRMVVLARTGDFAAIQGLQRRFFLQGLIGWIPIAMIIVLGAWPSTPGENRYGPKPAPL